MFLCIITSILFFPYISHNYKENNNTTWCPLSRTYIAVIFQYADIQMALEMMCAERCMCMPCSSKLKAQTSKPTSSLSLNIYIYNRTTWLNMTSEILLQSIYLNSQSRWKKKKEKLGVWKFVLAQGLLSHVRLCKLFLYKLWLAKKVTETIVSVSVSLPSCLLSASTLLLQ